MGNIKFRTGKSIYNVFCLVTLFWQLVYQFCVELPFIIICWVFLTRELQLPIWNLLVWLGWESNLGLQDTERMSTTRLPRSGTSHLKRNLYNNIHTIYLSQPLQYIRCVTILGIKIYQVIKLLLYQYNYISQTDITQ